VGGLQSQPVFTDPRMRQSGAAGPLSPSRGWFSSGEEALDRVTRVCESLGSSFSLRRFSMRGTTTRHATMLSTLTTDSLIPLDHPIRRIKPVVEAVLAELAPEFDAMYARTGRQSVPPEHLLKATVLMALYSVRSERKFCERLRYDLLFKFFIDLNVDDEGLDHSTFSRNRQRLLTHEIADRFFTAVVQQAHLRRYISGKHFSVDGTLLEAWARHKSFRPKDGGGKGGPPPPGRNAEVDYHGEKRSNETHQSTTDPEARPARKGNGVNTKSTPLDRHTAARLSTSITSRRTRTPNWSRTAGSSTSAAQPGLPRRGAGDAE
jgi:transposase